jgi:hypothetical protein
MFLHPNCEFKQGDLINIYWVNNEGVQRSPLYPYPVIFIDNSTPNLLLKGGYPQGADYKGEPRFYRVWVMDDTSSDGAGEQYFDRPYWTFQKA